MINLIWAQGRNGEIGLDNNLPWHLPEDLNHFKETTLNSIVVMGRKTYDSIGKPLPNRINVVLTRDPDLSGFCPTVAVYNSIAKLMNDIKGRKVFVIGGKEIFDRFMPLADKLIVTHIDKDYIADTKAPLINKLAWKEEKQYALTDTATVKVYIKN